MMNPVELVARREALGLSQTQTAELLGVAQNTVSQWEGGRRSIPDGVDVDLRVLEELQDDMTFAVAGMVSEAEGEVHLFVPFQDAGALPLSFQRVAAAQGLRDAREQGITVRIVEVSSWPHNPSEIISSE